MRVIRVGIIGAGMMGIQHAEAIRRVPGVEIIALADSNGAAAETVCDKLYIPHAYESYQEMLEHEHLDAVHICTPNFTHAEIARYAIQKGIHVFCEKPLGNTSRETEDLCHLAENGGVIAAINFNYRQNVIVQDMRARVHSAGWGRTFLIRGEYLQDWMQYDTDYNWRCVPELGGPSRTIADIGSHWFDTVQYITGAQIKKVYARLITVLPHRKKFAQTAGTFGTQSGDLYTLVDIDTEDAAYILFELTDGTPGILTVSQVSAGHKNGMVISIDGAKESLTWEQENPDKLIVGSRELGKTMSYAGAGNMHGAANAYTNLPAGHAVGWADALKNSIAAFYDGVRGKERRYVSFREGHQVVKIVEACLKSNQENSWIDVETGDTL